ncbi:ABC transporter substrate-binding protein [Bacillus subtilis]|nr:ABC transporter substrate-binding protein [Bacillus subtilis]
MKRHTILPVAGLLAAILALTACSSSDDGQGSEPTHGGSLTIGLDTDLTSLDPADNLVTSQSTLVAGNAIYEPLFVDGAGGSLEPRLAESIETDDLVEWTLTLKPGLTFSDGSPLDSAAVIAHLERMAAPDSTCLCQPVAAAITELEAVDDVTVAITLEDSDASFDRNLTRAMGMITSTDATGVDGSPLGAGAFTVASSEPGASVTLERNPEYHGDDSYVDELVFQFLPDTDSRYQSLSAGNIDIAWINTANLITQAQTEGYTTAIANSATATAFLNTQQAPFDDIRVRQAVQAAIDREVLLQVADQGVGNISDGPINSGSPYAEEAIYPAFDPDRATELLDDYGQPVTFSYTTDARPQSAQRATAIQQMLDDVGIEMTIDTVDAATLDTRLTTRDFDAIEFFTSAYGETDSAMSGIFMKDAPGNFSGYASDEATDLIQQAAGTVDEDARGELYRSASEIIVNDAPVLFFTESPSGFAATGQVGGIPDLSDRNVISILPSELWITA